MPGTNNRDLPLDGLRGIAVLLVMFGHFGLIGFGWTGVPLFFVLSGFLITRILLGDAQGSGLGAYLRNFYLRRALRILPALYLYLLVIAAVAYLTGSWARMEDRLAPAALFYYNFAVLSQDIAFSFGSWHDAATHPLWSLAVEEHFYLLWPLVVYCAGRRHIATVALTCIAAGPFLRWGCAEYLASLGPELRTQIPRMVYVLTTSHLDAFAAGAFVAARPMTAGGGASLWRFLLLAVAALVAGLIANASAGPGYLLRTWGVPPFLPRSGQYIWGYSLINLLFAQALVLALAHAPLGRLLASRPLTYTGQISYGLYLIHFVVIVAVGSWGGGFDKPAVILVSLALCYAIAGLSHRYFEAPILALKSRWTRPAPAQPGTAPGAPAAGLVSTL